MNTLKKIIFALVLVTVIASFAIPCFADTSDSPATETVEQLETQTQDTTKSSKAYAAGICVALAAVAGAVGMALAICKSNESIARQPEAQGSIRLNLLLGLVFIETAIIYALIVAILIIFVL